jgi:hypothetical protein
MSCIARKSIHSEVMKAKIWTKKYYWWAQDEPELPIIETWPYDFAEHFVYMG